MSYDIKKMKHPLEHALNIRTHNSHATARRALRLQLTNSKLYPRVLQIHNIMKFYIVFAILLASRFDVASGDDDDCASSCYKIASSGLRLTSSKMEECLRTNCGASRLDDIDMVEVASTKRERAGKKSDTDDNEEDCVSKCTSKKKRASKAGDDDMEKCLAECASAGGTCIASCPVDEEEKEDKRGNKRSMKREKKGEDTGKACVEYCETCEFNCLRNKKAPGSCVCKYPPDNDDEKNVDVVLTSY